ncbi:MAG: type IV pilus biogenesis protein EbsA [cyanobacterium endosymbiont of Rhopalodia musculus]|uniref:type IV pilus biogenesis protein EbsA n=1 Tax=cyanobacterium endosymbiont of Epithemia clementina EcSB TaxID=3034674 RepID=UPI003863044F
MGNKDFIYEIIILDSEFINFLIDPIKTSTEVRFADFYRVFYGRLLHLEKSSSSSLYSNFQM